MGGQTGSENAKTQTADRTDRADWRIISYLPKVTLQSGIPMIISFFFFIYHFLQKGGGFWGNHIIFKGGRKRDQ